MSTDDNKEELGKVREQQATSEKRAKDSVDVMHQMEQDKSDRDAAETKHYVDRDQQAEDDASAKTEY